MFNISSGLSLSASFCLLVQTYQIYEYRVRRRGGWWCVRLDLNSFPALNSSNIHHRCSSTITWFNNDNYNLSIIKLICYISQHSTTTGLFIIVH